MMRDATDAILDDLLARWHRWQTGFQVVPQPGADPMFRNVKSGRTWDSTADIIEDEIDASTMEAIDFQVGEMPEPKRSAIYANARNLVARAAVWSSPRLPTDPMERAILVLEARNALMQRLLRAGVM
jgi:hypothetical protein